ncbi:MAG: S-layer homology domain-containing protein, partial [Clostridiales bacterium]|nr:S-layer homology domain-containing protein [Clostridiales bacterium]
FDQVYGFTDVPQSAWYAKAVNWAACSGIVKGVTEDSFRPNAPVTREQAAAILYRFATLSGLDVSGQADLSRFADRDQIYSYAETPMSWAVSAGILYGTSSTELSPKAPSTRAQIAAMLMRFVTWSEGQGSSST